MSETTTDTTITTTPQQEEIFTSEKQIREILTKLKYEQENLSGKAAELEAELHEHKLVTEAMNKVDPSRKCWRLISDSLVELTAAEVLPAITVNVENISTAIEKIRTQLNEKTQQVNEIISKYRLQQTEKSDSKEKSEKKSTSSGGVLV